MNHCPHCGNEVPQRARHCPHCGNSLPRRKASPLPFYLIGLVLLVSAGLLIGNYLMARPSSATPPSGPFPPGGAPTENQPFAGNEPTQADPTETAPPPTSAPPTPIVPSELPIGRIVYTCQIARNENRNQLCIINADGSGQRRLTTDDRSNHFYASFSPDGRSIVFSSNQAGGHDIYEMDLSGRQTRLTSMGELYAPEISPDGEQVVFTNSGGRYSTIWVMERDGGNPHLVFGQTGAEAVDPTWSPDGRRILFALGAGNDKKLHTVNLSGSDLRAVSDDFITRGRSDWSPDGNRVAGYSGGSWQRKIYLMNIDGSGLFELFSTGNVQAPSFSPDGGWMAFTGYIDRMGDGNGCEIYIIRIWDGELKRLTDNDYCDWQPRWGP